MPSQTPPDDDDLGPIAASLGITRRTILAAVAAAGVAIPFAPELTSLAHATTNVRYQFPFPTSLISLHGEFGDQTPGYHSTPHRGLDFAPYVDASDPPRITAVADGTVVRRNFDSGIGNTLTIDHHDGYYSGYAHMAYTASVAVGTNVSRGQGIGFVGKTGSLAQGAHLHLSIGTSSANPETGPVIDPYAFIMARLDGLDPQTPAETGADMAIMRYKSSTGRYVVLSDIWWMYVTAPEPNTHTSDETYKDHYSPGVEPAPIGDARLGVLTTNIEAKRTALIDDIVAKVVAAMA